jgi:multidrug efflux system outer membrane protein
MSDERLPRPARSSAVFAAVFAAALLLAACASLAPELKEPSLETPAAWPTDAPLGDPGGPGGPGGPGSDRVRPDWWTMFGDPALDGLVAESLSNNRDVAQAIARVEEARGLTAYARADQLPGVQANAGAARGRVSERSATPLPPGASSIGDSRRVGIAAAYELDLWGRYRDASASARAALAASRHAQAVVRLSVAGQVVQAYFDLRALDAQMEITQNTLRTRNETVRLRSRRLEGGTGSALDLRQDQAEAAAAQATLAALSERVALTESALAVLLGRHPRAVMEAGIDRGTGIDKLAEPPAVPAGLPSQLLARRPDVQESHALLAAATADIGVARASYLPSLSLTASYGGESAALADVLTSPARIWELAASLVAPVFTAGRADAAVDIANARERQALARYEQTAINAFREVRDALSRRRAAAARAQAQQQRIQALEDARRLARIRYDSGYSGYLDVLDADRNLFQSQLDRVATRRDSLLASVDLIKSLGGGWSQDMTATE